MRSAVHFDDQVHIFFEGIFRNVRSDCESGMLVDKIYTRCVRFNKQPVSGNRDISIENKVRVLKINCPLERFHDLDCSFSIIVRVGDNERNFRMLIVSNWQGISSIR